MTTTNMTGQRLTTVGSVARRRPTTAGALFFRRAFANAVEKRARGRRGRRRRCRCAATTRSNWCTTSYVGRQRLTTGSAGARRRKSIAAALCLRLAFASDAVERTRDTSRGRSRRCCCCCCRAKTAGLRRRRAAANGGGQRLAAGSAQRRCRPRATDVGTLALRRTLTGIALKRAAGRRRRGRRLANTAGNRRRKALATARALSTGNQRAATLVVASTTTVGAVCLTRLRPVGHAAARLRQPEELRRRVDVDVEATHFDVARKLFDVCCVVVGPRRKRQKSCSCRRFQIVSVNDCRER
jgi:hypothetical protein